MPRIGIKPVYMYVECSLTHRPLTTRETLKKETLDEGDRDGQGEERTERDHTRRY